MKKGAETILLVFVLVTAGFLGLIGLVHEFVEEAKGITVPVDYLTIQDAINNSNDGDTIYVWAGIYYENIIVNKTLTITGNGTANTTIDGSNAGDAVRIEADWVNITGFTITEGTNGLYVNASNNVRIEDNIVSLNTVYGIYITSSSYNNIIGNNVTSNNENGIHLVDSTWNNIIDNNVIDNYDGIFLDASTHNNVTDNFILFNFDDGINLYELSDNNDISFNNVSSTGDDGIYLQGASNNTISHNDVWNNSDGIYVRSYASSSSYDNDITHNDMISNRGSGLYLRDSVDCTVTNNNATDNGQYGIYIRESSLVDATLNNAIDNDWGFYVRESSLVNVTYSNATNNNRGFYIWRCSYTNITNNNGSNNDIGIRFSGSSNCTISDNDLHFNIEDGINISTDSYDNTFSYNNISNSSVGIALVPWFFWEPTRNHIIDNHISDALMGIHLYYVPMNTIKNNTMISCGIVIEGDRLDHWNTHDIDTLNTVNGKSVYYLKNQTSGIISSEAGEVILANCTKVKVASQELTYGSVGIELGFSWNNTIFFNNASSNNWAGMYFWDSDGNNVNNNDIISNDIYGIWLDSFCENTSIKDNDALSNNYGLFLRMSPDNKVVANNASHNLQGIRLDTSDRNNITGNTFYSNDDYGINIGDSHNNTVYENDVIDNENGIYLFSSGNNLIYHNSILNNINQSFDDSAGNNSWDDGYPSGGNYWSDWSPITPDLYSGATTPQITGSPDGICDNQYDIDADSTDYYPLRNPWDPSTTIPTAPLFLTAADGVTYVNLSWNPPADNGSLPISNYRIYRGLAENMEVFLIEIDNVLDYNDTSVNGGTTYFYKVSAVNIRGGSPQSNEVNGTPLAPPDPPTVLALLSGNLFVNLSWFAPALDGGSPVIEYNIYRNGTIGLYDTVPASQLWFNDTNVTNGLTYTYNVTAVNSIGEGPSSSDENATPMTLPAAPEDLVAVEGDGYIALWWVLTDNGGSPTFYYNIYKNGTAGVYDTLGPATAWWIDSNVTNGITYTYNITAVNTVGEGPPITINATPKTVPSAPENPQISAGDEVVQITWDPPINDGGSAITGYNIYRSDFPGVYATVLASQLSYNDMNVVNGVMYIYRISANNSVGEGPKTLDVSDVPMGLPSAPENLQADAGNGYVNLTWKVPLDIGGSPITVYNIYRDDTAGVYGTAPAGQLWFHDDGVSNGVEYIYDVAAVNIIGEGPNVTTTATPMTVPTTPQSLQATPENGYVVLIWSEPSDDGGSVITEYNIYRDGTVTVFQTVTATQLSYEDHNVMDGVTYTYYVSANNVVGEGDLSNEAWAKAGSGPAVPSNFTANAGDFYVYLTWDAPASNGSYPITNYTIYRGTSPGGETFFVILGNVLSYNDTSAENDVTYLYRISATNDIAEGTLSNSISAMPQAPVIPINEPPTSTITSPSEGDSLEGILEISGTSSDTDGSVLRVEIKIDDGNWIIVTGTTSWTHSLDTTQLTDGEHTITVRAYDGENYSAETAISVIVANPEEEEEPEPASPLWLFLIVIIVIVLILALLLTMRKKKPEEEGIAKAGEKEAGEEESGGKEPSGETPPPPPWMKEEVAEEGEGERDITEEELEKRPEAEPGLSEEKRTMGEGIGEEPKPVENEPKTEPTDEVETGEGGENLEEQEEPGEEKDNP